MFANRTLEYRRMARIGSLKFAPISMTGIRKSLSDTRESISRLGILQEKHGLPSFTTRIKRRKEIDDLKRTIVESIACIERKIEDLNGCTNSKCLSGNIGEYFSAQLRAIIYDYRSIQQEFLKNIDLHEELEHEENENIDEKSTVVVETVKDLRKSIYDLTSILLNMRMAVGQQSLQIDRLDFYFDSINFYLESTNNELEKIPATHGKLKDKIMYSMLVMSTVLTLMSLMKMVRNR
ncbi:putative subunit of t-SNARE complex [Ordospora colligata]|nr:putative subunit of t-SNARE complex [Ordospora colligata]